MPNNKIELELGNEKALAAIEAVLAKLRQAEEAAQRLAGKAGSAGMADPAFRSALQEMAGAQGALSAVSSLQASAQAGVAPITQQSLGAAIQAGSRLGVGAIGQLPGGMPAGVMVTAAQQAAALSGGGYTPAFDPAAFSASVLQSAGVGQPMGGAPTAPVPQGAGRPTPSSVPMPPGSPLRPVYPMPVSPPTPAAPGPGSPPGTPPPGTPPPGTPPPGGVPPGVPPTTPSAQPSPSPPTPPANPPTPQDGPVSPWARGSALRALGPLAYAANTAFGLSTQYRATGQTDPMGLGNTIGTAIGATVGTIAGALAAGPQGAMIVGGIGAAAGGTIGSWFNAPNQMTKDVQSALVPVTGLFGSADNSAMSNSAIEWAKGTALRINNGRTSDMRVTASAMASGYAAMVSGMVAGGADWQALGSAFGPVAKTPSAGLYSGIPGAYGGSMTGTDMDAASYMMGYGAPDRAGAIKRAYLEKGGYYDRQDSQFGRLLGANVANTLRAMDIVGLMRANRVGRTENVAQSLTRRLGGWYPEDKAMQAAISNVGPIIGSLPETGGNYADILSKAGPMATYQYEQALVEPGGDVPLSLDRLSATSAAMRGAERSSAIGATRVRGSGRAVMQGLMGKMDAIGSLPNGADSREYQETAAQMRQARGLMYSQQDMTNYAIPMTEIEGRKSVMAAMPYAPGYRFGLELQSIAMQRSQIGVVQERMRYQRSIGQYGEQQELEDTSQIWSMRASIAHSVNSLTTGIENRLPALSAGRPGRFSRMDSMSLAAMNLGRMGHPGRSMGAANGRQLAMQDAFVQDLVGGLDIGPNSSTGAINAGFGAGGTGRMEKLLDRIATAVERGGATSLRVGEERGRMGALIGSKPPTNQGSFN